LILGGDPLLGLGRLGLLEPAIGVPDRGAVVFIGLVDLPGSGVTDRLLCRCGESNQAEQQQGGGGTSPHEHLAIERECEQTVVR
jgi:hypothetical protein